VRGRDEGGREGGRERERDGSTGLRTGKPSQFTTDSTLPEAVHLSYSQPV